MGSPACAAGTRAPFSFLTLAVPGIAAILAVGALLWSGSLRDRVHQQDAAMGALQEQNQKLADTLAQMSVEQKASSALNANADSPNPPAANPRTVRLRVSHQASAAEAAQSQQSGTNRVAACK